MNNRNFYFKNIDIEVVIFISVLTFVALFSSSVVGVAGDSSNEIVLNFSFTEPNITNWNFSNTAYHNVTMNETCIIGDIGLPRLPVKSVFVLLPQKGILETINVTYSGNISMGYGYNVTLEGISNNQSNVTNFDTSKPYPYGLFKNLGTDSFRGYSILVCHLYPVHYIGDTGEIYYYENMTLTIKTNNTGLVNRFFRRLERDEDLMKDLVDDYSMNYTYTTMPDPPANSTIISSGVKFDFVIITKKEFVNASREKGVRSSNWKTFEDLADYKNSTGIKTKIVTIEKILSDPAYYNTSFWGDGDYKIFNDTQCRIRNFIKHAASPSFWNADYFLLGGDNSTDDGEEIVPARNLWYKYEHNDKIHEGSLPSDMYYACLDGSFNEDKDKIWGDPFDGAPGGDFDEIPSIPPSKPYPTGIYYAEADPAQYNVTYEVGLFTPPFRFK